MAKNLLHCETGFGVYRSTQLGHIPFFLLLYLLVGPSIVVELVPTLMIDDAETKMRTEASVLFELKTSVPFCHALQICELIYVDIYLARSRQVLR
jgi:hypothetical protein